MRMTITRPFSRAFLCAAIFCAYAVPYAWMYEPGHTWPMLRTILAAVLGASLTGTIAMQFGWALRWWQFVVAFLLAQVLVACVLELGAHLRRQNHASNTAIASRLQSTYPAGCVAAREFSTLDRHRTP